MRRVLGALVVVVLVGMAGYAQTFRGAINGSVTDPSGAVVAAADVKATAIATGAVHSTTTTTDGQFAFQDLPLGVYRVTVTVKGFQQTNVDNVTVTAGNVYTLPVKLSIGRETTAVEVSAAALQVDTTTTTQSDTIPTKSLQDMPLNGRDFSQLIAVTPGYGGYSVGGFGSLNGTRANQMNWQIDGTDNNDFWHNIPAVNQGGVSGIAGVVLPIDAIDEFSAQTQSNAESGRNAGGVVNFGHQVRDEPVAWIGVLLQPKRIFRSRFAVHAGGHKRTRTAQRELRILRGRPDPQRSDVLLPVF